MTQTKVNAYLEMKQKHQEAVNELPIAFAFSNEQFAEGMKTLGLKPTDTDKVYSLMGGGFYRRTDSELIHGTFKRHAEERIAAIAADETGDGYIYDMFRYELANHEYGYTMEIDDTIDALGYTYEEITANPKLLHGLEAAKASIKEFQF